MTPSRWRASSCCGGAERAIQRVHVQPPHRLQHQRLAPVRQRDHHAAAARRPGWKIHRAEQARRLRDKGNDLLAVPGVVAQRDHVRPGGEQRLRHVGAQPEAVRGILGVDDRQVDAQRRAQPRQGRRHRLATGAPDHVAQEQDAHSILLAADDAPLGGDGVERHVVRPDRHRVHLLRGEAAAEGKAARRQRRQRAVVVTTAIAQPVQAPVECPAAGPAESPAPAPPRSCAGGDVRRDTHRSVHRDTQRDAHRHSSCRESLAHQRIARPSSQEGQGLAPRRGHRQHDRMVRVRENSESIALYGGENQEEVHLRNRFNILMDNFWRIMWRQKKLSWLTNSYSQAAVIFPLLMAAPAFFAGQMHLGGLMQTVSAFGAVHGSLSYLITSYTTIAKWKAVVDRLLGFTRTMERIESPESPRGIKRVPSFEKAIIANSLNVSLPNGKVLVRDLDLNIEPGARLLITGPSGCGKSTLVRSLAGIWPFCNGTAYLPGSSSIMFLPQKPYLPLGTLHNALCYPHSNGYRPEELEKVLETCGLGHLGALLEKDDKLLLQDGRRFVIEAEGVRRGEPTLVDFRGSPELALEEGGEGEELLPETRLLEAPEEGEACFSAREARRALECPEIEPPRPGLSRRVGEGVQLPAEEVAGGGPEGPRIAEGRIGEGEDRRRIAA